MSNASHSKNHTLRLSFCCPENSLFYHTTLSSWPLYPDLLDYEWALNLEQAEFQLAGDDLKGLAWRYDVCSFWVMFMSLIGFSWSRLLDGQCVGRFSRSAVEINIWGREGRRKGRENKEKEGKGKKEEWQRAVEWWQSQCRAQQIL